MGLSLDRDTYRAAITAMTLCGARNSIDARRVLQRVRGVYDLPSDQVRRVERWLSAIYPANPTMLWGSIQPDRLAENFITHTILVDHTFLRELLGSSQEFPHEPDVLSDHQIENTLALISRATIQNAALDDQIANLILADPVRLAPIYVDVSRQAGRPTPFVKALYSLLQNRDCPLEAWSAIGDILPRTSQTLASVLVAWQDIAVMGAKFLAQSDASCLPELASELSILSVRLNDVGEGEEAIEVAYKAIEICRSLTPVPYLELARVLNNCAIVLKASGRHREAFDALNESASIGRDLAKFDPEIDRSELAVMLSNRSAFSNFLESSEEALRDAAEAVSICRDLAEHDPEFQGIALADVLMNYSARLADAGKPDTALSVGREALALHSAFAQSDPDANMPKLAYSFQNIGSQLCDNGDQGEGLAALRESVTIFTSLARSNSSYTAPLADSLHNLSIRLMRAQRIPEALIEIRAAIDARRTFMVTSPPLFPIELIRSLLVLGEILIDDDTAEEAVQPLYEALEAFGSENKSEHPQYQMLKLFVLANLDRAYKVKPREVGFMWEEITGELFPSGDIYKFWVIPVGRRK